MIRLAHVEKNLIKIRYTYEFYILGSTFYNA